LVAEGLTSHQQESSKAVQARMAPRLPEAARGLPLSQQALLVALSTPGVTCVLNGARQPRYVDDSLGALALPPLAPGQSLEVLRGFAEAGE
jgi:aryl-alcohol dehydrogenase-like predicted oxidoreductase